ncbi:hypothetical protein AVEN_93589-1 [Araneus ventricosus]|uniref:Uncharacterized protein n=1 Tax=Araneus ventricosus TaxID=182803 RepID=A0A4Y2F8Q0_ARAVE|nr:hypothetical protein AVEN_93589-1 [Araneus ventricosus]
MDFIILNRGQMRKRTPELVPPFKLPHHTGGRTFGLPTYDLMRNRLTYTTDIQWKWVSNQEPFGPKPRPYHSTTTALLAAASLRVK